MSIRKSMGHWRVIPLIFLLGGAALSQPDNTDNGLNVYEIQSTADLARLEAQGFGIPYDPIYGNENDESTKITMSSMDTAVIVLYSLIIFVGLIANSVVFFVIFAGHEIGKTVTTIYILMLTIADSIFLLTLPIFSMQKLSTTWNFGTAMCSLCQTIKFLNYYAGIFFLTAMSIDRYIAVAYSTRLTQIRTKERTYLICALVWIAAVLMTIPVMLYAKIENAFGVTVCRVLFPGYEFLNDTESAFDIDYYSGMESGDDAGPVYELVSGSKTVFGNSNETHHFKCNFKSQPHSYKVWLVVNFFISFVIPFSIIVVMYALILVHLRTAEQRIGHTATNRAARTRKRVTKMVAALVVCFTICWLPHHLLILARIPGFESAVASCYGLEEFFSALAFSNSALNPILYTFLGNNFKERFRKSVQNTQLVVKRRTSSRGSAGFRRSLNSHSGEDTQKKSAGIVMYHKSPSNGSGDSRWSGKRKKSQIALLGLKRDRLHSDGPSIDESQRDQSHYPSLLEHTMQTKLDA